MSHECIPLVEGDTSCLCGKEILTAQMPFPKPTPAMPLPVFTVMFNRMGGF